MLHRTVFFRPATGLGQFLPPSLATAMEELASTSDAKAQPLCVLLIDGMSVAIKGKHHARSTSVTGRHGRRPASLLWATSRRQCPVSEAREIGVTFNHELPTGRAEVP
jgi:hypothetical protein